MGENEEGIKYDEITWDTVNAYLNASDEVPIPMCDSESCVLVIKPESSIELQLRTGDAYKIDHNKLPKLIRFRYENVITKSYRYLSIVCEYLAFDAIVLKYFNTIAMNYVKSKLPAIASIVNAYNQWKKLLAQQQMPDLQILTGIWGELFIIDHVLSNKSIDAAFLVQNWTGSLGAANDFSFGDSCIEIKTITKQSNIVEISSIDQLDAARAWLVLLRVLHTPVSSGGITIHTLADKIRSVLDVNTQEVFNQRIDEVLPISDLACLNYFSLCLDGMPAAFRMDHTYPLLTRTRISEILSDTDYTMLINTKYTLNLNNKMSACIRDIPSLFRDIIKSGEEDEQN